MKLTKTQLKQIIREEILSLHEEVTPDKLETFRDVDKDTIYIIPKVKFTGNIKKDIEATLEITGEFLYADLGTDEGITDKKKKIVYWGSDVQDNL